MDVGIATVIAALIVTVGGIIAARVGRVEKRAAMAEKTAVETKASMKEMSDNLPSWDDLYEHDENGKPLRGSLDRLIEAIQKGYPIKVRIKKPQKDGIEVMDAQWIFVEDRVVIATNTDQISLGKDESGNYRYFEESYHYYVIVNSKGQHHATRIFLDGSPRGKPSDGVRHMTWIGLVPPRL
jgi:hypothetical protein